MQHQLHTTFSRPRRLLVLAVALVALAVSAPLAAAAHARSLPCRETPTHWVTVVDEQGVPNLEPASQHR